MKRFLPVLLCLALLLSACGAQRGEYAVQDTSLRSDFVCDDNNRVFYEIFVGSFKACASVVSKGGVSVEATNTDQDDFIKNRMTIRCEERLALAVRRPAGFVKIVKAATDPQ